MALNCSMWAGLSTGGKGEVYPGPATFGARHRSKILEKVFQMASF